MKTKIILCTGGSRSGKSAFAEEYALAKKGKKVYIATARIYDEEMQDRVRRHQDRRGKEWLNYEVPLSLAANWEEIAGTGDVFLLDCLTMYVMNYVMEDNDINSDVVKTKLRKTILDEMHTLLENIEKISDKTVVMVTNEIGWGIIPNDPLTRFYRDVLGEINQMVARVADEVYLSVSGITMEVKAKEVTLHES